MVRPEALLRVENEVKISIPFSVPKNGDPPIRPTFSNWIPFDGPPQGPGNRVAKNENYVARNAMIQASVALSDQYSTSFDPRERYDAYSHEF